MDRSIRRRWRSFSVVPTAPLSVAAGSEPELAVEPERAARRESAARDELQVGAERLAAAGLAACDGHGAHPLALDDVGDPGLLAELADPDALADAAGVAAERGCGGAGMDAAGAVPPGGGRDQGHPALRSEDGGRSTARGGTLLLPLLGCARLGALDAVGPRAGPCQRLAGALQQGAVVHPEPNAWNPSGAELCLTRQAMRRGDA